MSNLKFYVPSCAMCPAMKKVGPVGHEIRDCTGFPGKKQKRLPKNSLKKGVASWCSKQISPPACRVLGFVDEDTAPESESGVPRMEHFEINNTAKTAGNGKDG